MHIYDNILLTPQLAEGIMVDIWRDFWIRETGTGQQVAQIHERYMMMILFNSCYDQNFFRKKIVQKINTHILYSITSSENRAIYEAMWKNMAQSDMPQMTV